MEDKGWDPYAEYHAVLEDLNQLMQVTLPAKKFQDHECTNWRLGLLFYSHIVEMSAPYEALTNLLRFCLGKGDHLTPKCLQSIGRAGATPNYTPLENGEIPTWAL
jgi:hypothetical protein